MEKSIFVDQKHRRNFESVQRFVEKHQAWLAEQGRVVTTWRRYGHRRLGPYYRLSYREGGQQRSLYLGRSQELADEVRALLAECQGSRRRRREWQRLRDELREALQRSKADWRRELARVGLRLHGNEVRGWRSIAFEKSGTVIAANGNPSQSTIQE